MGTSTAFSSKNPPAGKAFRDGPLGDALSQIYAQVDAGFSVVEDKLPGTGYTTTSNPTVEWDGVDTAGVGRTFSAGDTVLNIDQMALWVCLDPSFGAAIWQVASCPCERGLVTETTQNQTQIFGTSYSPVAGLEASALCKGFVLQGNALVYTGQGGVFALDVGMNVTANKSCTMTAALALGGVVQGREVSFIFEGPTRRENLSSTNDIRLEPGTSITLQVKSSAADTTVTFNTLTLRLTWIGA